MDVYGNETIHVDMIRLYEGRGNCMNVAFIPVRGGSKSIPFKNIKEICGKPLVYWTVKAACKCQHIDEVYISTDSDAIRQTVMKFSDEKDIDFNKVRVIDRSAENASDIASTESAMLEFAEKYEFNNIVLIQATSPLLSWKDLNNAFEIFESEDTDSVISAVRQKRFNWAVDKTGNAYPTNYDVFNRPRRQEFDGYLVENGAFYITSKKNLMESRNRVSGRIKIAEMSEDSFFEIDEPSDWIIIEALLKKRGMDRREKIPDIKLFLTDCDGCMTDGGMYYSEKGDELKKFNAKDGMGFELLRAQGIKTGIITAEDVELNKRRANKLKVDYFISGCKNKFSAVNKICSELGISVKNVAYMGDDINDVETLKNAGLSFAPANAIEEVKECIDFCTKLNGGDGAVREAIGYLLLITN